MFFFPSSFTDQRNTSPSPFQPETYTSLEMSSSPSNLYHPLALESPSEELSPSRRSPHPQHLPPHLASVTGRPSMKASSGDTASSSSSSASSDDTTTTGASSGISRDPLYFETEPIYSDAYTPHNKRRHEPLYHETVPDDIHQQPSNLSSSVPYANTNTLNHRHNTAPRKSVTPPQTLLKRSTTFVDSPPPVPTSRRPSGAISPLSSNNFVEGGGGSIIENTKV